MLQEIFLMCNHTFNEERPCFLDGAGSCKVTLFYSDGKTGGAKQLRLVSELMVVYFGEILKALVAHLLTFLAVWPPVPLSSPAGGTTHRKIIKLP